MAKRKTNDEEETTVAGNSPAARLKDKFKSNKDLAHGIHVGSDSLLSDVERYISTQAPTLDYAIGQPGIPTGKITTIFGREGSGKSLLGYHILAETQRIGGIGILADTEGRFTKDRFENIGGNLDELIIVEGLSLEATWDALMKMIKTIRETEAKDVPVTIVFDSVAEAVPGKRLEADTGDSLPALVAKFFGAEMGKLKMLIAQHDIAFIFVNQVRSRIEFGSDPRSAAYAERNKVMGPKQSMLAEWPLLFGSALMLRVNSLAPILDKVTKDREKPIGVRSRVTVVKCGLSPHEGYRAELDILFSSGYDRALSAFDLLVALGHIKSGAWCTFVDPDLNDGKNFRKDDFEEVLAANPSLNAILEAAPRSWVDDNETIPDTKVLDAAAKLVESARDAGFDVDGDDEDEDEDDV